MELDYDFDRAERAEKRKKFLLGLLGWIIGLAIAIGLAWGITTYMLEITNMADSSMEITLKLDDTVMINKLAYVSHGPERFEVIVFKKDGKEHSYYSIKRVIGLPGETVLIHEGKVYIDGVELFEPMLVDEMRLAGLASGELILDEDEYFVLGDNRNASEDSRFANVGNVVKSEIIGEAWIRTNHFGIIGKINMNLKTEEQ